MNKVFFILLLCIVQSKATMRLVSPAFSHNETIPMQYTCDGTNISPALTWSNAPENTQSFVLIVDDPSFAKASSFAQASADRSADRSAGRPAAKPWIHWIVFNIPSTIDHIRENQGFLSQEAPFMYGATDFNGKQKWGGPCPPSGIHHYHFTLYALDTMLDVPAGETKEDILSAMQGHILEQTTLIGTYQRKK